VQRLERQPRPVDDRKLCRPWFGHPSRQQRAGAIRLLNDKVVTAGMLQLTHDGNAFAHARMFRILDQNIKGLFLGSMSLFRRAQCPNMS
jgi:hypothetical protein